MYPASATVCHKRNLAKLDRREFDSRRSTTYFFATMSDPVVAKEKKPKKDKKDKKKAKKKKKGLFAMLEQQAESGEAVDLTPVAPLVVAPVEVVVEVEDTKEEGGGDPVEEVTRSLPGATDLSAGSAEEDGEYTQ